MDELDSLITSRLNRQPRNLEDYKSVYLAFANNPNVSTSDLQILSGVSSSSFYRILKEMKVTGILEGLKATRHYQTVNSMVSGILPPKDYRYVHLAYYLTKYLDTETVPPYGKTKKQVVEELKEAMLNDSAWGMDIMYGIHNRYALLAILKGDLNAFKNMIGKLEIPERLID